MESALSRIWWAVALRGVLAIIFGVLTFFWPHVFWIVVVAMFAAYAFVDGGLALYWAVSGREEGGPWWAMLLQGVVGIAAGVLAILWPDIAETALLAVVAAWALMTGALAIVASVWLRRRIQGEWTLALSGVLSVLFGLGLVIFPGPGLVALAWLVASWSVAFGIVLLMLAFALRSPRYRAGRPDVPYDRRPATATRAPHGY
jgi:uncharacterized membrane protein HdeD (DUF308 family)